MKITTQRSLLWTVNFVIVFALIGCVLLMANKGAPFRRKDNAQYARKIEDALDLTVARGGSNDALQSWARFKTPLDRNFHFEGYVKPIEPERPTEGPKVENAPKLETLIAVHMVLAPIEDNGPAEGGYGAASIKVLSAKKRPGSQGDGIDTYVVGDVIGIGQDYRDDKDPILEKWGPCRLLEVKNSAVVCSWNKGKDTVEIGIDLSPPSGTEVLVKRGDENLFGSEAALRGKEETDGGVFLGTDKLTRTSQSGETTLVSWTEDGFRALENEGEKLLDQVEVESARGGDGLKITSLPSRLSEFGIQAGDVIIEIDSQPVKNKESAINYVRKTYKKKSYYNVTVLRDGRTRNIQVDVPRKLSDAQRSTRNIRFGK